MKPPTETKASTLPQRSRPRRGFSLVEIMIAMGLFGLMATATVSGVLQMRKLSENAVYESSAITAATGYLEQMKGMEYEVLLDAIEDPDIGGLIPTRIDQGLADYLYNGKRTKRMILIDTDDEGNVESEMTMYFTPALQNLYAANGLQTIQIELQYEWLDPHTREFQTRVLRSVRSDVSSL